MAKKNKQNDLVEELALALEVASICNLRARSLAWGNPSPFQEKINELLVKAGRKAVLPPVRPDVPVAENEDK